MKRFFLLIPGFFSFSAMSGTQCQGLSLCLHDNMILLHQDHQILTQIIRSNGYPNYVRDQGNCAPTASAMAISTMAHDQSRYNASYDPNIFYRLVFNLGQMMRTDWMATRPIISGGTVLIEEPMRNVTNSLSGTKLYSFETRSKFPNRAEFVTRMPVIAAAIGKPAWYLAGYTTSGHVVTLNGYEGYMLKIYDPWARIYNVESYDGNSLINPTGWGFIASQGYGVEVIRAFGGYQQSMNRGFIDNGLMSGVGSSSYIPGDNEI